MKSLRQTKLSAIQVLNKLYTKKNLSKVAGLLQPCDQVNSITTLSPTAYIHSLKSHSIIITSSLFIYQLSLLSVQEPIENIICLISPYRTNHRKCNFFPVRSEVCMLLEQEVLTYGTRRETKQELELSVMK